MYVPSHLSKQVNVVIENNSDLVTPQSKDDAIESVAQAIITCPQYSVRGNLDLMNWLASNHLIEADVAGMEIKKVSLNMLAVVEEVEQLVPQLLKDQTKWKSLFIDYQPPHLMRIFTDIQSQTLGGKCARISLHYFLPALPAELNEIFTTNTDPGENLYHPHGWASCMRILDGVYDQNIGFAKKAGIDAQPEKLCSLTHSTGDSYAMNHPWLWHQVNPRPNQAVSTMMVTHIPECWDQEVPRSTKPLRALNPDELDFMFNHFKNLMKKSSI